MPGIKSRGPARTDAAPDRLRRFLDAQRSIGVADDIPTLLDRTVRAACELTRAHYATIEADGTPVDRLSVAGRLQVPIAVSGAVFGILCLTEPTHGHFDAEDAELAEALAATAATAIETTQLREDAARSRDWLRASGEITRALLAEADSDTLLDVVARALHVAEADYAAIVLPTDDGRLKVSITAGIGAEVFQDLIFDPENSPLGEAMIGGRSLLFTDMSSLVAANYQDRFGYGPVIIAPLVDAKGTRGSVILIRLVGRPSFSDGDLDLLTTFADQVALAIDMADTRAAAETLRTLEQRHQIAQDLHDNVMQRLFATGVGLQSLADGVTAEGDLPPDAGVRLRRHVAELDETIDEIRNRVFGLRGEGADGVSGGGQGRLPRTVRADVVS